MQYRWGQSVAMDVGGRAAQEDSALALADANGRVALGIVADGLGGHGHGYLASGLTTALARKLWDRGYWTAHAGPSIVENFILKANEIVLALQQRAGNEARTTVCCALAHDNLVDIASVGDSRAYLVRSDGALERLTRDHSVTEMLLANGEIDEDEMRTHPDSSRLTQSLGKSTKLRPFISSANVLKVGEAILLCSDGLWQALSRSQIEAYLAQRGPNSAGDLMQAAVKAAGRDGDNVSVVLLRADMPQISAGDHFSRSQQA